MVWRHHLRCFQCHSLQSDDSQGLKCWNCEGLLEVKFDLSKERKIPWKNRPPAVWRYRELLPLTDDRVITTLNEGGTGLHHCVRLGRTLGLKKLYVKNEGENPTGSFKDRGMTVAIARAQEIGAKKMICASTGNTAASLAAYSARAGLVCTIFVPVGKVAGGKMLQVLMHGAKIVYVKGTFDQALETVLRLVDKRRDLYLMNSLNPFRLEGQKTLAFEIVDQLDGNPPDITVLPVGNGGNISAAWKGFSEFQDLGIIRRRPRMIGIQAEKAAPITEAFKHGRSQIRPVTNPRTLATAIRIGSPVNAPKVLRALRESGGLAEVVTDSEILEAQRKLASLEGIFVEPASAASIAGLKKIVEAGMIDRSDLVVCVTTGHGLKDPSVADRLPKPQRGNTLTITDLSKLDSLERKI